MISVSYLFEVSIYRSNILKDIDQDFAEIKKDKQNHAAQDLSNKNSLIKNIKEFTGIQDVKITLIKDFPNACVIPIYTRLFSLDLLTLYKDYKIDGNIKNLNVIEEPSKYIKKIHIIFGYEFINMMSPRELTSILLHELGHVFAHTANLPRLLVGYFKTFLNIILSIPMTIPIYLVTMAIVITLMRSFSFLDHRKEYKADQFAAKYGYGDEMIKGRTSSYDPNICVSNVGKRGIKE